MPNSKITEILKYNAADRFYFFFQDLQKKKKNQFSYFNSKRKTDLFHSLKILIHMTAFNLMQRCLKTNSSLLNFFFLLQQ